MYDDATKLNLECPVKKVRTGGGETFTADALTLTMGSAYRKLGLPEAAWGTGCAAAQDAQHYLSSQGTVERNSDRTLAVSE